MARYTGPSWKLSRRLGISLSGTGKELENALTLQVHTVQDNVKIIRIRFAIARKAKASSHVRCKRTPIPHFV